MNSGYCSRNGCKSLASRFLNVRQTQQWICDSCFDEFKGHMLCWPNAIQMEKAWDLTDVFLNSIKLNAVSRLTAIRNITGESAKELYKP